MGTKIYRDKETGKDKRHRHRHQGTERWGHTQGNGDKDTQKARGRERAGGPETELKGPGQEGSPG